MTAPPPGGSAPGAPAPRPGGDSAPGSPPASLRQVVAAVEARYPPGLAEDWDAVGLVCGDPGQPVRRVLLAVDPVDAVVDEAVALGADLLLVHHPLLLRGVHGVAATDARGRAVHRLVRAGCALLTAHTNADAARPGVSDALADALGVAGTVPLRPASEPLDKVVVFVPHDAADAVLDALAGAGAGRLGDYDRCAYAVEGTGQFRPLAGASPHVGEVGRVEHVAERRLEMVAPRARRAAVVAALLAAHPYEEPAYDVLELAATPAARTGLGRVGTLPAPETLAAFADRVAAALPAVPGGVRVAGDPGRAVRTVAVCGGSGDSLLAAADAAGADVLVTADLRHHRASEHLADGGCALVDVAHWASEWPWLPVAARALAADAAAAGASVDVHVSTTPTDPWTAHVRSTR